MGYKGIPLRRNDEIVGFTKDNATYFYIKDAEGDVIGLVNSANGNIAGRYSYDPWGKSRNINTNDSLNPIRYRGYYYDYDMPSYYLQSRYYRQQWGRFLNADLPEIAQQSKDEINGLNLFAYCCNDPVNNEDPSGYKVLNGYKTQHEAAKAFGEYYFWHSYYIQFEICAVIYKYDKGKKIKYGVTAYAVGDAHKCVDPLRLCNSFWRPRNSQTVAVVHTHPNKNGTADPSIEDMNYGKNNNVDMYVVNYFKEIYYYNHKDDLGKRKKIYKNLQFKKLSSNKKKEMENRYRSKWKKHLNENCTFNCRGIKWPAEKL